jgi:hypothetical protein
MSVREPATTAPVDGSGRHRGRFVYGLGQTLAIWLTVLLLVASVRHVAAVWAGLGAGAVMSVLLGKWHHRGRRVDTAVGAFTGVALWPFVIAAVVLAIGIVAEYRSE